MGEARNFGDTWGGQLRATETGKGKRLTSSRQRSREAEDAKDPSYAKVNPSCVRASVSYIVPGRAKNRSGQDHPRYQFDVVTHMHI
jgi:hypothetical protein